MNLEKKSVKTIEWHFHSSQSTKPREKYISMFWSHFGWSLEFF